MNTPEQQAAENELLRKRVTELEDIIFRTMPSLCSFDGCRLHSTWKLETKPRDDEGAAQIQYACGRHLADLMDPWRETRVTNAIPNTNENLRPSWRPTDIALRETDSSPLMNGMAQT